MSSPSDLTTLANVKSWLNVSSSMDDALLSRLITAVSNNIQQWLNRQIASQSYNETRDGNGKTRMVFYDYPVTAVASVMVDDNQIPLSTDINTPGYWFNERELMLRDYEFCRGEGNVSIQYTAGYATTPPELEQACIEVIALRYSERSRIGHQSKSLQGETVSFTIVDYPKPALAMMQNYKKVISSWRGEAS